LALSTILVSASAGSATVYPLMAGICLLAATLWPRDSFGWVIYLLTSASVGIISYGLIHNAKILTIIPIGIQVAFVLIFALSRAGVPLLKRVGRLHTALLLILLFVTALVNTVTTRHESAPIKKDWKDARNWVRTSTPEDAVFLIPPKPEGFQLDSNRKIWVDFKQGAAVMWSPSFFSQWHRRLEEVQNLSTFEDWSSYACTQGIDYLVFAWPEGKTIRDYEGIMPEPVFSNAVCAIFSRDRICHFDRF